MASQPTLGKKEGLPRRVAVVAYAEYPWDPRVRREAETLVEDGYLVHIIALRPRAGASSPHFSGVHLHEVPVEIRRGGKIRYAYQYAMFLLLSTVLLLRLQLGSRFDLVHVHSLPDFQVFCALPLKLWRVPVLLDLHEAMPEIVAARFRNSPKALLPRVAAFLEQLSSRFADHVVVANDGIRAAVVSRGMQEARLTTVYNASDIPVRSPAPEEIRRQLGLPEGRLLVHAGGINPERDLETLLLAVARLPADLDVYLILAGDGEPEYIDGLRRVAAHCQVADRVQFVGKLTREEAMGLMALSEVGVITLQENPLTQLAWPTRIVEYANLRKPLVVPKLRFLSQMLGDGADYYMPGDAESLSLALSRAIRNPDRVESATLKVQGICRRFDWTRMREVLRDVYRSMEESRVA